MDKIIQGLMESSLKKDNVVESVTIPSKKDLTQAFDLVKYNDYDLTLDNSLGVCTLENKKLNSKFVFKFKKDQLEADNSNPPSPANEKPVIKYPKKVEFVSCTASSDDGHIPGFAIDGNESQDSRWSAKGDGEWLQLDLSGVLSVFGISILWYKGYERVQTFSVDVSLDGKEWTTVLDKVSSTGKVVGHEVYLFEPTECSMMRVINHGNSVNDWISIVEASVNGLFSEDIDQSVPYLPPEPLSTTESSVEPVEAYDEPKAPSDKIDLTSWKITLPVTWDQYTGNGSDKIVEIYPTTSKTESGIKPINFGYSDDKYFYLDDEGICFRASLLNAATTENAKYIRTELRELYDYKFDENSKRAAWKPSGYHQLNGTCRVASYYKEDPQVVVGQIHATYSSKALVKLTWDAGRVRVILNKDPEKGNPFSIDFCEVGQEWFDYSITLEDDTITMVVNDVTKIVAFGVNGMSDKWKEHTYYFKAGNYPQSYAGNDGVFVVKFSALSVTHK